jgi:MFS family permease
MQTTERRAFEALSAPGFAAYLATFALTMMADNIEHVISYWVAFQKFHSPALGGFAVVSHWLPYLLFSVAAGALNDRFDSRRIIQIGGALFMCVSIGWGYFFLTGTLQMWHAMVLLVLHGCAGVLWNTSSQMLLYDIVGPAALQSAVRLNATARYLAVFIGPLVGNLIMLLLGPTRGIFINAAFYLPLLVWLVRAPYGRHFRGDAAGPKRAARGIQDIVQTLRDIRGVPAIGAMVLLAGMASFFVGNSYQAQMPGFAHDPRRVAAHADELGGAHRSAVGRGAAGVLVCAHVLRRAAVPVSRRLLRAVVQQHGADAGADPRARDHPRPRARPVRDVVVGVAHVQRPDRRHRGKHRLDPCVAGRVVDRVHDRGGDPDGPPASGPRADQPVIAG